MRRWAAGARRHALAALGGSSVAVKALCGAVALLYALSLRADTAGALGVTPGRLLPPGLRLWTLLTHGLAETRAWGAALSVATLAAAGRLLEPLWGALELLLFFAVVNAAAGLLGALAYALAYAATARPAYLFGVRIHGALGFLGGVLVALKQRMGESAVVAAAPALRVEAAPAALLALLALLRLGALVEGSALVSYAAGALSAWVYLRFWQRQARGGRRGDASERFAFATFFPAPLRPPVALVAAALHGALVRLRLCPRPGARYDVGAPSAITISLPGSDPHDAERRRQLALKALNERLKRVEDQAAWPSMEDDEEAPAIPAPTIPAPAIPAPSAPAAEGSAAAPAPSPESSLISLEEAPRQP